MLVSLAGLVGAWLVLPTVKYETVPATRGPLTMIFAASGRLVPASADPSQWQIQASLPETGVVHIEAGQDVECSADAFPGQPFKGRVIHVDEAPEPGREPATYSAAVQVADAGLRFRRGMTVSLAFIIAHRPDTLKVPCQALGFHLYMPGGPADSTNLPFGLSPDESAKPNTSGRAARAVWVLRRRNRPEPVQIRIGITDGAFTEVVAGLSEGDRVIVGRAGQWRRSPPARPFITRGTRPRSLPSSATVVALDPAVEPGQTMASNAPGFGPVIERLLDFDGREATAYLDLDTGQYLDPASSLATFATDATPAGVDLRTSLYESDDRARLAVNMALRPVATNRWEATPAEIRQELARAQRQAEFRVVASHVPQLYFFRTSEGGQGIIEFRLDPATGGRGAVRVRYKSLLGLSPPTPEDALPGAPAAGSGEGEGTPAVPKTAP
jgi:hypothetical protein